MRVVIAHHLFNPRSYVTSLRVKKALASVLSWKKAYPEFDVCFYADPKFDKHKEFFISNQINFYPTVFKDYDIPDKIKNHTYAWPKILVDSLQTEPFISCDSDAYVSSRFFEEKDLEEGKVYVGLFFGKFSEVQKRSSKYLLYQNVVLPPNLQMPGGDFTYYFNPILAKEVLETAKQIATSNNIDNGLDEIAKASVFYKHNVTYTTLFPADGYHHKDEYEEKVKLI